MEATRTCRRCSAAKPLADFSKKSGRPDGLQSNCKPCAVIMNREWRRANPERARAHTRSWEAKNPEKVAEFRARARQSGTPRAARLRRHYKLTVEQFDALLADQGGVCASCGQTEPDARWHVDHDHACCAGEKSCGACVRGVLCFRCNAGIGVFRDDPAALRLAAAYLDRVRQGAPGAAG